MNVRDWLKARQGSQPPGLAARILELSASVQSQEGDPALDCLAAAERALGGLLAASGAQRESALDLLAIDSLVTYAFEAAAACPERIPTLALEAMTRLSHVAPNA